MKASKCAFGRDELGFLGRRASAGVAVDPAAAVRGRPIPPSNAELRRFASSAVPRSTAAGSSPTTLARGPRPASGGVAGGGAAPRPQYHTLRGRACYLVRWQARPPADGWWEPAGLLAPFPRQFVEYEAAAARRPEAVRLHRRAELPLPRGQPLRPRLRPVCPADRPPVSSTFCWIP